MEVKVNISAINYYNNPIYKAGVQKQNYAPAFSAVYPMINRKPSPYNNIQASAPVYTIRTSLTTRDEKLKYNKINCLKERETAMAVFNEEFNYYDKNSNSGFFHLHSLC